MTIVLNEHEWAKEMIENKNLGDKPYETLCRVAKYYIDKNYTKDGARKMLEIFIMQCDPLASLPKWSKTLDYAVTRACKYDAIDINSIIITDEEMKVIRALNGKQIQRLAFTLLCLAKYWDLVNPTCDHWVNSKDSEIMHMANINTSIKRQSMMYHILNELDLIQFSKKIDNTNVRVLFMKEGKPELTINDFRSLGYQYLKYLGEPYFECKNCGIVSKINNPSHGARQKYCKACALEVAMKQRVNSVMRQRGKGTL